MIKGFAPLPSIALQHRTVFLISRTRAEGGYSFVFYVYFLVHAWTGRCKGLITLPYFSGPLNRWGEGENGMQWSEFYPTLEHFFPQARIAGEDRGDRIW